MTLFSASAAFRALMNIMEDLYGRKSYAGVWRIAASVAFSVLFLLTIYLALVVLLTGGWLFHLVERLFRLETVTLPWDWQWFRFLLLFLLVFLFVLLVYRMAAPRGRPRPPILTGAFLAAVALVAATALFSWFIGLSSRYSLVYGSLASVIILLVWLYLCGNILILGNVFNCVWYRHKKRRVTGGGRAEKRRRTDPVRRLFFTGCGATAPAAPSIEDGAHTPPPGGAGVECHGHDRR